MAHQEIVEAVGERAGNPAPVGRPVDRRDGFAYESRDQISPQGVDAAGCAVDGHRRYAESFGEHSK